MAIPVSLVCVPFPALRFARWTVACRLRDGDAAARSIGFAGERLQAGIDLLEPEIDFDLDVMRGCRSCAKARSVEPDAREKSASILLTRGLYSSVWYDDPSCLNVSDFLSGFVLVRDIEVFARSWCYDACVISALPSELVDADVDAFWTPSCHRVPVTPLALFGLILRSVAERASFAEPELWIDLTKELAEGSPDHALLVCLVRLSGWT